MKHHWYIVFIMILAFQILCAQESLENLREKVENVARELAVAEPNQMDPLSLNETLVWSADKTRLAIIIKAELLEGWHAYAYVPENQPYIQTEVVLELPNGITKIKDWIKPQSEPYDVNLYTYSGELLFIQYCSVGEFSKTDKIITGLYYQTCDIHKCFPPETKVKNLVLE